MRAKIFCSPKCQYLQGKSTKIAGIFHFILF